MLLVSIRSNLLLFILFCFTSRYLQAGENKLNKSYRFLTRIQSPYKLLSRYLPKQYVVDVTLSGSIADELNQIFDSISIEPPKYAEIRDKKRGIQLVITNDLYTAQTRDLLSGIINPVEMIDVILNSVLKYQEIDNLIQLQKETTITNKRILKKGCTVNIIEIEPTGQRFNYIYRDMGAYIQESWFTKLSLVIDTSFMLARELSLLKQTRMFNISRQSKPSVTATHHRYIFSYIMIGNTPLPCHLEFYTDSVLTLTVSASYRQSDEYILFDKREICYFLPDRTKSRLVMQYGEYEYKIASNAEKSSDIPVKYTKKLRRAAAYARKAIDALNQGRVQTAIGILKMIRQNYQGTPQAVEAQKLLSGLPKGL